MDRFEIQPSCVDDEAKNLTDRIHSLIWCSYLNGFYASCSCIYETLKKANESNIYISQKEFLDMLEKWQKDAYNDLQKQKAICEIKNGIMQ